MCVVVCVRVGKHQLVCDTVRRTNLVFFTLNKNHCSLPLILTLYNVGSSDDSRVQLELFEEGQESQHNSEETHTAGEYGESANHLC